MIKLTAFVVAMLLAGPALAQSGKAPAAATTPAENSQMCDMTHNGAKMQGMMAKGKDGKMTCQMMDHAPNDGSQMDHGMMNHSQMDHGQMKMPQPDNTAKSADPSADAPAQDHTAHPGHSPG